MSNVHLFTRMGHRCISHARLRRMDPFWVGLFNKGSSTKPVIRMVFALASDSDRAGVLFPSRPKRGRSHVGKFTAFDIWCAGLMSFKSIGGDFDAYTKLLDRSLYPHDTFNLDETTDRHLDDATKKSRAQGRQRMAALIRSGGHFQIRITSCRFNIGRFCNGHAHSTCIAIVLMTHNPIREIIPMDLLLRIAVESHFIGRLRTSSDKCHSR